MSAAAAWKKINHSTRSAGALTLLLGACVVMGFRAAIKIAMGGLHVDEGTLWKIRTIGFVHEHLWIAGLYMAIFLACMLWLEWRDSVRWSKWATFAALAVPCLVYAWGCAHVGSGSGSTIHLVSELDPLPAAVAKP